MRPISATISSRFSASSTCQGSRPSFQPLPSISVSSTESPDELLDEEESLDEELLDEELLDEELLDEELLDEELLEDELDEDEELEVESSDETLISALGLDESLSLSSTVGTGF